MPRILKLNHIGVATADAGCALKVFGLGLGLPVAAMMEAPDDAVRVTFLPVGDTRIELLEPQGEEGPVQKFLANRGPGVHHLCFEVEDLPGMLDQLRAHGVELVDNEPRPGAEGTLVAFIHPKSANGVLIELVESPPLPPAHHSG